MDGLNLEPSIEPLLPAEIPLPLDSLSADLRSGHDFQLDTAVKPWKGMGHMVVFQKVP